MYGLRPFGVLDPRFAAYAAFLVLSPISDMRNYYIKKSDFCQLPAFIVFLCGERAFRCRYAVGVAFVVIYFFNVNGPVYSCRPIMGLMIPPCIYIDMRE